jgi:hypothetical protein
MLSHKLICLGLQTLISVSRLAPSQNLVDKWNVNCFGAPCVRISRSWGIIGSLLNVNFVSEPRPGFI